MLKISIDKILPLSNVRANLSKVVNNVEKGDIYVITRGGKPSAVIAPIDYIKKCDQRYLDDADDVKMENPVQKSSHLVSEKDVNNLPNKIENKSTEPAIYEEKSTEIVEKNEENLIPEKIEESKIDKNEDVEENVPIKVSNGSWN